MKRPELSETMNLDDLELELRKLPGVRAAGFHERDDLLVVQVQVTGTEPSPTLSQDAARIAFRHADKPVAVEVVRWRTPEPATDVATVEDPEPAAVPAGSTDTPVAAVGGTADAAVTPGPLVDRPPRVRLLAVLTFPDTDELEVHLTYEGRRVIGRATASRGVTGAVSATVEGLRAFFPDLNPELVWAEELPDRRAEHPAVVACAVGVGGHTLLGLTAGNSRIEAAARATLHALNRTVEEHVAAG